MKSQAKVKQQRRMRNAFGVIRTTNKGIPIPFEDHLKMQREKGKRVKT